MSLHYAVTPSGAGASTLAEMLQLSAARENSLGLNFMTGVAMNRNFKRRLLAGILVPVFGMAAGTALAQTTPDKPADKPATAPAMSRSGRGALERADVRPCSTRTRTASFRARRLRPTRRCAMHGASSTLPIAAASARRISRSSALPPLRRSNRSNALATKARRTAGLFLGNALR